MSKETSYVGRISQDGVQHIEAPIKTTASPKSVKKTGSDLRSK